MRFLFGQSRITRKGRELRDLYQFLVELSEKESGALQSGIAHDMEEFPVITFKTHDKWIASELVKCGHKIFNQAQPTSREVELHSKLLHDWFCSNEGQLTLGELHAWLKTRLVPKFANEDATSLEQQGLDDSVNRPQRGCA